MRRVVKVTASRRRVGLSELMGSLLMIALTLVAGAAVFGWVDSQAGVSEGALGAQAASQANYFRESFVNVGVQFYYNNSGAVSGCKYFDPNTYCNEFTVYVYNNGAVPLTIESVAIYNSTYLYGSGSPVPLLSVSYSLTKEIAAHGSTPARSEYTTGSGSASYTCGAVTSLSSSSRSYVTTFNEPASTTGSLISQPVAEQSAPPTAYTFTLPSVCALSQSIVDGASYTIQLVGLYGNSVTTEVTANG